MVIGTFGKIIFQTSQDKVLTFGSLSEKAGGNYASQALLKGKPRKHFIGAEAQTVELDMTIRADLGFRPREVIRQLKQMTESGIAERLIIGGVPVSDLPLVITSMSAEWGVVYRQGELFQATITLSLEEYR